MLRLSSSRMLKPTGFKLQTCQVKDIFTCKDCSLNKSESNQTASGTDKLSDNERLIHKLHTEACQKKERTYIDPINGYKVFTEFAHRERGSCCGSACRHCPYGQINVNNSTKKKSFNSVFYV